MGSKAIMTNSVTVFFVILSTVLVAMLLSILPLPVWAAWFRPEWLIVVVIYWALALPDRVSVGTAWLIGLFFDVLNGGLLAQRAMAFAIVIYIVVKVHHRVRVFPIMQQALCVLFFVAIYQLSIFWVQSFLGQAPNDWRYWLPSISSAVIWPWLFIVLRDIRRRFQLS